MPPQLQIDAALQSLGFSVGSCIPFRQSLHRMSTDELVMDVELQQTMLLFIGGEQTSEPNQ